MLMKISSILCCITLRNLDVAFSNLVTMGSAESGSPTRFIAYTFLSRSRVLPALMLTLAPISGHRGPLAGAIPHARE
jgi:hypothetical protein